VFVSPRKCAARSIEEEWILGRTAQGLKERIECCRRSPWFSMVLAKATDRCGVLGWQALLGFSAEAARVPWVPGAPLRTPRSMSRALSYDIGRPFRVESQTFLNQ